MLDKAVDEKEFAFRMFLAVACLIAGTFSMFVSVYVSFVPLSMGLIVALAGLILVVIEGLFS